MIFSYLTIRNVCHDSFYLGRNLHLKKILASIVKIVFNYCKPFFYQGSFQGTFPRARIHNSTVFTEVFFENRNDVLKSFFGGIIFILFLPSRLLNIPKSPLLISLQACVTLFLRWFFRTTCDIKCFDLLQQNILQINFISIFFYILETIILKSYIVIIKD